VRTHIRPVGNPPRALAGFAGFPSLRVADAARHHVLIHGSVVVDRLHGQLLRAMAKAAGAVAAAATSWADLPAARDGSFHVALVLMFGHLPLHFEAVAEGGGGRGRRLAVAVAFDGRNGTASSGGGRAAAAGGGGGFGKGSFELFLDGFRGSRIICCCVTCIVVATVTTCSTTRHLAPVNLTFLLVTALFVVLVIIIIVAVLLVAQWRVGHALRHRGTTTTALRGCRC